MPLIVRQGSVRICKLIKDGLIFWVGVGRTTPWPNENSPPAEDPTLTTLQEIQGYKRVDSVQFVVEDPNGTILFRNRRYRIVPEQNIYTEGARWLYLTATLLFDQFPIVTFRQTGIFVDVVPTAGNENKDVLLPNQVQSARLIGYVNHQPRIRVSWGKDVLEFVLQIEGVLTTL